MSLYNYGFMAITNPNIGDLAIDYFQNPKNAFHKQYEALRAFFCNGESANKIAEKYGYQINSVYSLIKDFKEKLKIGLTDDPFFRNVKTGRKEKDHKGTITDLVITLRKQYISVPDIKGILDSQNIKVSERYIFSIIQKAGFARLPRRDKENKKETQVNANEKITAPKSQELSLNPEIFNSQNIGILCFLPFIKKYGIDKIIETSSYPETSDISKLSSILNFLCLKLSNIRRYNADDIWCMDRGMGLFSKLNVLPKTSWFSSYSSRVTRKMNLDFLKQLHKIWLKNGLLSDTMNLDFTTIPYWGDDNHLENNWSGKRNKALASMLAVLAQDPDSGIIDYGDTNVRHKNSDDTIIEFFDFYHEGNEKKSTIRFLVFDSKFTTYQNMRKLDDRNIKFLTIRRRGKNIVDKLNNLLSDKWKNIHVMNADGKGRNIKVFEEKVFVSEYGKELRQIAITGHGKIKPALIITNDFKISLEDGVRKYCRRWIVEKGISEQIEFFHLNHVSSSVVIKVDFDFTMTILAHNLYRIFAANLDGYSHQYDQTIFEKFISNSGEVQITDEEINVSLKKKRSLPILLSELNKFQHQKYPWLDNKKINFLGASTS